jgi:hypothetical protein
MKMLPSMSHTLALTMMPRIYHPASCISLSGGRAAPFAWIGGLEPPAPPAPNHPPTAAVARLQSCNPIQSLIISPCSRIMRLSLSHWAVEQNVA